MAQKEIMPQQTYFNPSTPVVLITPDKEFEAKVLRTQLSETEHNIHPIYEVAWWVNGERKTQWVEPCELKAVGSGAMRQKSIGFRPTME